VRGIFDDGERERERGGNFSSRPWTIFILTLPISITSHHITHAIPRSSIHADPAPDKAALAAAAASLPGPVPGVLPQAQGGPPVLYCGLTAGAAFGASAYLLLRGPGRGNVLIDSPRFDKGLAARILAHGPVDFMFLTHRDDVADHAAWAGALACPRIIHAKEANPEQGTDACEVLLDGAGPWSLPDGDADIELFLQPGHTEASVMLHHAPSRSLFPGDVIAFTGSGAGPLGDGPWTVEPPAGPDGTPGLVVHRAYTWFSIPTLLDSLEAGVVGRDWLHLLPGHGRMGSFKSGDARDAALREVIGRERANDAAGAPARSPFF
jgi:glyoxylase-like metal-dependent hydrolase (beta-lactamase superfamily II)